MCFLGEGYIFLLWKFWAFLRFDVCIFSSVCPFFLDILRKICTTMFMDFELFRRQVKANVFDYQLLTSYLKKVKKPRDKIPSLISEGKIVRLKKGLYISVPDKIFHKTLHSLIYNSLKPL